VDETTGGGGLEWMAWTPGTAIFVAVVFASLLGLAVLAAFRPPVPRRGFLPIATTLGDRIYVGLLGVGFIFIALIALTALPLTVGLGLAVVWMAAVLLKG
jgi:predicted small integral membrane protein